MAATDLLRAHAAHAAGRVGRGRRRRQLAALRRAARLWRPARGVLRDEGRVQAHAPGAHHRRLARLARQAGAAHGAADARAAHPPREGHAQRVHRAGAARRDGRHVRGVARPGGAHDASRRAFIAARRRSRRGCASSATPSRATSFFDTLRVELGGARHDARHDRDRRGRRGGSTCATLDERSVGVALDETVTVDDVHDLLAVFDGGVRPRPDNVGARRCRGRPLRRALRAHERFPARIRCSARTSSETEMLRYMRTLESRDLSLTHSMIPLGWCTMKLNATAEMFPVTWPEFGGIHPFAPARAGDGLPGSLFATPRSGARENHRICRGVAAAERRLAGRVRGTARDSRVPSRRAANLHRNVCLIPQSAHGTNPASAVMAGHAGGGREDRRERQHRRRRSCRPRPSEHTANLAALMVTYPSTHGVFEESHQGRSARSCTRTAARSIWTAPT